MRTVLSLFSLSIVCSVFVAGLCQAPAQQPGVAGYDGAPLDPNFPVVVRFVSPALDEVVTSNAVDVFLAVDNYALASGGNSLHVLCDNAAPVILENIHRPVVLRDLAEGGHTLRVFACKPGGLALTNNEAFAMVSFSVRKRDFQNFIHPELPFLTVNNPMSGVVEPDAQGRVWLDFRASNAIIGPGGSHVVRYECNNIQGVLTGPFFWPGMKPGRYQLKVELLTPDMQPVPGFTNKVERQFEVRANPSLPAATQSLPVALPATPVAPTLPTTTPPDGNSRRNAPSTVKPDFQD